MASFNQIVGTPNNDDKTTTTLQDILLLSGGDDIVRADFQSVDYIIGGDGQDKLITSFSYESFTINPHQGIADGYIIRYTGADGKANIVKGIEIFQFAEGTISLQDFIDGKPIENNDPQDRTVVDVDDHGTIDTLETMSASSDHFLYKDSVDISNYVVITDFTEGDKIEIAAGQGDIIVITNNGEDIIITNNSSNGSEYIVSSIILLGVVSSDNIISDEAAFEQAVDFDAININII